LIIHNFGVICGFACGTKNKTEEEIRFARRLLGLYWRVVTHLAAGCRTTLWKSTTYKALSFCASSRLLVSLLFNDASEDAILLFFFSPDDTSIDLFFFRPAGTNTGDRQSKKVAFREKSFFTLCLSLSNEGMGATNNWVIGIAAGVFMLTITKKHKTKKTYMPCRRWEEK
jgi:hypothetical protein